MSMSLRVAVLALLAIPAAVRSQQPAPRDSTHQHGDSLTGRVFELAPVTIATTPPRRDEPTSAVRVPRAVLERTPAIDAYDLLRQTAGIEVHEQGQGPGFASDASVRGFSSDHSTDLALWVDGVPNNEPVNGHAEGYNDWNLLFPQAIQEVDVLKGPTSALYGKLTVSVAVNVRTIERMRGVNLWLDPASYGRAEGVLLAGFDNDTTAGVFGVRGVREDGWRPHSDYRLGQGHGRLVHQLTPRTTLDAGVELYATGWNSPGYLTEAHFTAGAYNIVANPNDGGFKSPAPERISPRRLPESSPLLAPTPYGAQGALPPLPANSPAGPGDRGAGGPRRQE